jgi:hypothetical protein
MNQLIEYALDTENPEKNYNLAVWYEEQNHTAPALTYFLRAAERNEDKLFAYNSLIRGFFCYDKQGSRDASSKILLENALCLLPKRPEAYFLLSRFYERKQEWQNSYIYATLGLEICDFNLDSLSNVEYPGKYGLIFEKSVSAYWWGKGLESRKLLQVLLNEYWDVMDEDHQKFVESNIMRLGTAPANISIRKYSKNRYEDFKLKFDGCQKIEKNYSQVMQDMFVLFTYNGKKNGTYLEIGAGDPYHLNNTYLLESEFDWSGLSLEIEENLCNLWGNRKNKIICKDASIIDYKKILDNNFKTKEIDYLQLDCEPSKTTFETLLSIPFEEYKFGIITYEHDHYNDITRKYRSKSRKYLKLYGYELVFTNISPTPWSPFEDWWVHPDLVDVEKINKIKNTDDSIKQVDEILFENFAFSEIDLDPLTT